MSGYTALGIATATAIQGRKDFQGNSMSGENVKRGGYVYSGRLNKDEAKRLSDDMPDIVYVVWSYGTPIAWVKADGTTYKVAQKFSVTTSRHQGNLYLL